MNIETCEICGKDFPTERDETKVVYICNGCKEEKSNCMNCDSLQLSKDIEYLGGEVWQCPNCKEKDERKCYLCDSVLVEKYCENTSCAEYIKDEGEKQNQEIGSHDFLILNNGNTFRFYWSDQDYRGGYMYDVYIGKVLKWEQCDETDADDGGLCTGSLHSAMEMAGIDIS